MTRKEHEQLHRPSTVAIASHLIKPSHDQPSMNIHPSSLLIGQQSVKDQIRYREHVSQTHCMPVQLHKTSHEDYILAQFEQK